MNTLIGFKPAWRGIPLAAAAGLMSAKATSDATIKAAEAATLAAAGTPGAPAAYAAEQAAKTAALASMGSMITGMAAGADIHMCTTPVPVPPHGPGVVVDGSPTVLINNLPACRVGDTIIEALGPPNKIAMGETTVIIGQSGSGGGGGGGGGAGAPGGGGGGSSGAGFLNVGKDTVRTVTGGSTARPGQVEGISVTTSTAVATSSLGEASDSGTPLIEPCEGCEALSDAAG